jgi:DNA-binding transcriptional ArsR family regulator
MIKTAYQITFEQGGIKLEGNSLDILSVTTKGYPYLFQLMGSLLWRLDKKVVTEEDVRLASIHARNKLFADVHSLVFRELSDMDQQFLMAMSDDQAETKIINLRERLEKSPGVISKYRERLMNMGIVESEKYGTLQFVLPYMRDFLLEKQKELYFIKELSAEYVYEEK